MCDLRRRHCVYKKDFGEVGVWPMRVNHMLSLSYRGRRSRRGNLSKKTQNPLTSMTSNYFGHVIRTGGSLFKPL